MKKIYWSFVIVQHVCFPLKVKQHKTFVCKMSASFGSGSLHTGYLC